MNTWPKFTNLSALVSLLMTALLIAITQPTIAGTNDQQVLVSPAALRQQLANAPTKLSIVLVSTPGCGFCKLVRERQLTPLLRDPDFKDVAVFEVTMRDDTPFTKPIISFHDHSGTDLGQIRSVAELSEKLDLNVAPTLLFLGKSGELAERLVGYGVPDYYFSYLSERIDTARAQLIVNQQK